MRLAGKAAIVIGASRGMGKQMALRLAMEGADVAVAARTDGPGQSAEPELDPSDRGGDPRAQAARRADKS